MKKTICTITIILLFAPCLSLAAPLDLTDVTQDELLMWKAQIDDKLTEMGWYPFTDIDSKSTGEPVLRLQERLAELNFYAKEPTGKYDSSTSKAFSEFMKAQGLKAGKTVTIENQELLFSSDAIAKPTPTPPPTPTPAPTPIPDEAVLEITSVSLRTRYNTKTFSVSLYNHSSDFTIDAFTVAHRLYNAYDELISTSIVNETGIEYAEWWRDLKLKPKGKFSMGNYYWYLYGDQTAARIEVAICRFHTTDGETIEIPPEKYVWVEGTLK